MSDFSLGSTFGRASFLAGCLWTLNFRGVGWAKWRKRIQSTRSRSGTRLVEVPGRVEVDDADADADEIAEDGRKTWKMGRGEGVEAIGRGRREVGGKRGWDDENGDEGRKRVWTCVKAGKGRSVRLADDGPRIGR